jgi:adenylate cyclase class 2
MRETEIKIRVESPVSARRALGLAGLVALTPRLFEDNRLYDTAEGRLRARDELLRLRTRGHRHTLTFKRPEPSASPGEEAMKVRIEHETAVDDLGETHALLEGLGYRAVRRYQKYRQSYARGPVRLELDETPIGTFLELEGPAAEVDRLAGELGFTRAEYIRATYHDLVEQAWGAEAADGDMLFPEGTP